MCTCIQSERGNGDRHIGRCYLGRVPVYIVYLNTLHLYTCINKLRGPDGRDNFKTIFTSVHEKLCSKMQEKV